MEGCYFILFYYFNHHYVHFKYNLYILYTRNTDKRPYRYIQLDRIYRYYYWWLDDCEVIISYTQFRRSNYVVMHFITLAFSLFWRCAKTWYWYKIYPCPLSCISLELFPVANAAVNHLFIFFDRPRNGLCLFYTGIYYLLLCVISVNL